MSLEDRLNFAMPLIQYQYVPAANFSGTRLSQIEASLRGTLGEDFEIYSRALPEVEKTERGKHRWLVSTLPGPALAERIN